MKFITLLLLLSFFGFSQQKTKKHKIVSGETISSIAQKYDVKISEIYDLNPKAKGLLKLNSTLKIPNKDFKSKKEKKQVAKKEDSKEITFKKETTPKKEYQKNDLLDVEHEVLAKQTLYRISKIYGVTMQDIKDANPILEKEGLEIGLKLIIPGVKESKAKVLKSTISSPKVSLISEPIARVVLPKETKFGIAKEYGLTVEELEKQNPEIINGLPIGFVLKIANSQSKTVVVVEDKQNELIKTDDVVLINSEILNKEPEIFAPAKPITNVEVAEQLVVNASENIGVHYRSGGTTKDGFDCSGLMVATFASLDLKLPRTSREQSQFGVKINPIEAQKGDLIFFSTNGTGGVNHVGMVVEVVNDEIKFIHSSSSNGVMISSNKEMYYARRFVRVNRVLE